MSPCACCSTRGLSTAIKRTSIVLTLAWAAAVMLPVPLPMWAGASNKHHSSAPTTADPDYVFALATANRFLHAWQMGDFETGMVLLSDRVRHSQNPEKVEQFFSGDAGRAFEIARGRRNRGRYRFEIVLVTVAGSRARRRRSEIIVINAGKNDWVVDKLP